ncbi:MAG TPA: NAD(P)-binding domain-containing protein [Mycobacterium sp.]|nr:NAD(P)-binding domain-containing protein [Mycobacterium sp.]
MQNLPPDACVLLTRRDVLSLVTWDGLIGAARRALVEVAAGPTAGASEQVGVAGASLHLKVGVQKSPAVLSVKANLRPDDGVATGAMLVFDTAAHRLQAIMPSADITALRTAAVAAVAADHLLPGRPAVAAILGAGPLARRVDEALAHLGLTSEVRWWSRSPSSATDAAEASSTDVPSKICDTVAAAVDGADVVITCTPSREPILDAEHLGPDALVLAMGADSPGKRELSTQVLEGATQIYADVPENAFLVGDCASLGAAVHARVMALGASLASPGEKSHGRTVFDSVGSSVVDAAVAAMLVEQASRMQIGLPVDLQSA